MINSTRLLYLLTGTYMSSNTWASCWKSPLYVIVEFAPYGNLRDFLRQHRPSSGYERAIGQLGCTILFFLSPLSFFFKKKDVRLMIFYGSRLVGKLGNTSYEHPIEFNNGGRMSQDTLTHKDLISYAYQVASYIFLTLSVLFLKKLIAFFNCLILHQSLESGF